MIVYIEINNNRKCPCLILDLELFFLRVQDVFPASSGVSALALYNSDCVT